RHAGLCLAALCVAALAATRAYADEATTDAAPPDGAPASKPMVVWPTLTPAGDDASPVAVHKPAPGEVATYARAQELDVTMRDAVQDLGFTLDVADQGPTMGHARDLDIVERASHAS